MTSSNADQDEEGRGALDVAAAAAAAAANGEPAANVVAGAGAGVAQEGPAPRSMSPSQLPDDTQSGAAAPAAAETAETAAAAPSPIMVIETEGLEASPHEPSGAVAAATQGSKTLIMEEGRRDAGAQAGRVNVATQGEPLLAAHDHHSDEHDEVAMDPNAIPYLSPRHAALARGHIGLDMDVMNPFTQISTPRNIPSNLIHALSSGHTVTPAQINLSSEVNDGVGGMQPLGGNDGLESFARIEFADSVFQMTTFAVIIGRDQRALTQAKKDEKRAEEYRRMANLNEELGLPMPDPIMPERNLKFSKSYVSEEGGMLGPESDGDSNERPAKRRKTASTGSSHHEPPAQEEDLIMNRQYVSHTPGAAAVDLQYLRPSPHHTPFIGIHSPGPDIAKKTKAISREHLKIQFNKTKNVFEAIPLHKNGFFCDDIHYAEDTVELKSGARLQIKDVDFTFIINGVERGCTGAEELDDRPTKRRYSEGGKEMSVEFEIEHGQLDSSDDEKLSELEGSPSEPSGGEMDVDNAGSEDEEMDDADAEKDLDGGQTGDQEPVKRRGPGRPPKDGIMSKRERRERNKKAQEEERQRLLEAQAAGIEPPIKRKVGRPRKHPLPDEGELSKSEKRKYKPRKPKEEGENSDAERRRERKERKVARPKSPPLNLKREDFTEEQLMKPSKNYGVLIDEILTEAGPAGLTLKQIYNRITLKYPFYYFFTETKGWESSVRHNLIGNEAFKKVAEGGTWHRVEGVELDAGKKKKGDSATAAERAARLQAAAVLGRQTPALQMSSRPPTGNRPPLAPGQPGHLPTNTLQGPNGASANLSGQALGPDGQPLAQTPGQSQSQSQFQHHGQLGQQYKYNPEQSNGNGASGGAQNQNPVGQTAYSPSPGGNGTNGHGAMHGAHNEGGHVGQLPPGFDLLTNSLNNPGGSSIPASASTQAQPLANGTLTNRPGAGHPSAAHHSGGHPAPGQPLAANSHSPQEPAETHAITNYYLLVKVRQKMDDLARNPHLARRAILLGAAKCVGVRAPTEGIIPYALVVGQLEFHVSDILQQTIDEFWALNPDATRTPLVSPDVQKWLTEYGLLLLRDSMTYLSDEGRKVFDLVLHGSFAVALGLLDIEPPAWWLRYHVRDETFEEWAPQLTREWLEEITDQVDFLLRRMGFICAREAWPVSSSPPS